MIGRGVIKFMAAGALCLCSSLSFAETIEPLSPWKLCCKGGGNSDFSTMNSAIGCRNS